MKICILLISISSEAKSQSNVLVILNKEFKSLSFDSSFVQEAISFDSDTSQFPLISRIAVDSLFGDFTYDPEFVVALEFRAIGVFPISERIHGYLIRSWADNTRENQTFLLVIEKMKDSFEVIDIFFVGVGMGSECCEHSTAFRFSNQNADDQLDLIVNSYSREVSGTIEITRNQSTVYLWMENTFHKSTVTTQESYDYQH